MIPLFLGLTGANLALLLITFALGMTAVNADGSAGGTYNYHLALGITAGLLTTLCHVAIYTYFMATTRWLQAAADKVNLDAAVFVAPALKRKSRSFPLMMIAIGSVMIAMFLGAAFDPTMRAGSTRGIHLAAACVAIAMNVLVAIAEFQLIRAQGKLMDVALADVNRTLDTTSSPTKLA
jgi:uncharacterized membrane protein YidH (DUF202 family)